MLMMNPDERREHMATRRKTTRRKTTTRRKRPARASAPRRRRRPARKTTTRRRRIRRKNPKADLMGALLAAVGGAAIGGGAYALDGQDMSANTKTAIMGLGGMALGVGVGMFNDRIGCGIAGGGAAIAVKSLLEQYLAAQATTAGMGRIPAYARRKFGSTPTHPHYYHMPAQLDAVQADLIGMGDIGAVVADLDAVEASLIGV